MTTLAFLTASAGFSSLEYDGGCVSVCVSVHARACAPARIKGNVRENQSVLKRKKTLEFRERHGQLNTGRGQISWNILYSTLPLDY